MKTLLVAITAVMAIAAPAHAEPDNPGASGRMAAEGYVRAPASPADRRLAGMSGDATAWNGDPIWKLLIYCGAMHSARRNALRANGASAAAMAEEDRMVTSYTDLGTVRFTTDRGMTQQSAFDALSAENAYWTFYFAGRSFDYAAESRTCRAAEVRNRMAR